MKFPELPAAAPLTGTEIVPVTQGANDKRTTTQDIADLAAATGVDPATVTAPTNGSGTVTIDCALGDYFTHLMTANVTTLAFSNLPGSGKGATKLIRITQDSTPRTFAWPAAFKWSGAAPAISTASGKVDFLAITTFDNGTTWLATLSKDFA